MAIDYDKLLNKLSPNTWYTGRDLDSLWGINSSNRKSRVGVLIIKKKLLRKGKTSDVKYRLMGKIKPETKIETKTETTLDALIKAATKVGIENEVMKKALLDAKTLINKALETTT